MVLKYSKDTKYDENRVKSRKRKRKSQFGGGY
jgi:hypothetical protein